MYTYILQIIQPWEKQILTRVTTENTKIWTRLLRPEENWIAVSDGSYYDTFLSLDKKVRDSIDPLRGRRQNRRPFAPDFTTVTPTCSWPRDTTTW